MKILETARLLLRTLEEGDAPFYLNLLNSPPFLANIGDRGVRTLTQARASITSGPMAMQSLRGHSIWLVALKESGESIGMSGLIKRDTLDDVDLGYAFLPPYFGKGYAHEAALAVLEHARTRVGLERVVAITSPGNTASNLLLEKLGMHFEKVVYLNADDPGTRLYGMAL